MPVTRREPLWPGSSVLVDVLDRPVTTLLDHQVFVFGSNGQGFHGAGSAGIACRGDGDWRTWRSDPAFTAMRAAPPGSDGRRGRWAVFGVARGYQVGLAGQSYAIETIERPGRAYRRRTPLRAIYAQLRELVGFAAEHPGLEFVVTPIGEGYSGYSRTEMSLVWRTLHDRVDGGIPTSFHFVRLARDTDLSLT
jgi:hypothetical protein